MTIAAPLLKYPGGKRKVAQVIADLAGPCDVWVEPFVGTGAAALAVPAKQFLFADASPLIQLWWRSWQALSASPDALDLLRAEVARWPDRASPDLFLRERHHLDTAPGLFLQPSNEPPAVILARLRWLNRAAYGGVMRSNRAGRCNSQPAPATQAIPPLDEQRARRHLEVGQHIQLSLDRAVYALSMVALLEEETPLTTSAQTVVYLDPPFVGTFAGYSHLRWSADHLSEHARAAERLHARVLLSEHDTPEVHQILGPRWAVAHRWQRSNVISAKTTDRTKKLSEAIYIKERT